MGTKLKPGTFDCYANAKPDEPMFILLARDPLAPILVKLWADLREHAAGNPSKVAEARMCALAMKQWRQTQQADPPASAEEPIELLKLAAAAPEPADTKCGNCGLLYRQADPKPCPYPTGPDGLDAEYLRIIRCTFRSPSR
jgi:hypothetical protein